MLCGAILPEHWTRLQVYAARVRILSSHPTPRCDINSSVWPFLAEKCKGFPLMPHLRSIGVYGLSVSDTLSLTLLLSPTLRNISLWVELEDNEENRTRSQHIVASLLQTIPLIVPDLECLEFGCDPHLPGNQGYLEGFRGFKGLKSLSTFSELPLNEHLLRALASMGTLQDLSCWIDLSGISTLAFPQHYFKELTELTVRGHSDHLVTLILACQFSKLEYIRLWVIHPPNTRQPRDPFSAVSQHCNPALLTSFSADFTQPFASRLGSLMEYFEPLLALPNITSFHLVFFTTEPSVRDDDLIQFGTAWPRLISFRVQHRTRVYSQADVGRPTLSGIIELARRCPDLTTLHIPELDPRVIPEKYTAPPLKHGLQRACIDNILPPLGFKVHMDVATVLDRVFPAIDLENARSMAVAYWQGKGWEDVLRLMEAMRVGRENGGM